MSDKAKSAIPKPRRQVRQSFLGKVDMSKSTIAADNMREEELQALNFKVTPSFHHRFKSTAAIHRKSMKELLEEAFDAWIEKNEGKR